MVLDAPLSCQSKQCSFHQSDPLKCRSDTCRGDGSHVMGGAEGPGDEHGRELTILNAVAEVLNSSLDVTQALEGTLALVAELLGLRAGWVWLLDAETDQFYVAASRNLPP